jgi:hypothetical protein
VTAACGCFPTHVLHHALAPVRLCSHIRLTHHTTQDLINRDYLERDKDNPNLFKYLA